MEKDIIFEILRMIYFLISKVYHPLYIINEAFNQKMSKNKKVRKWFFRLKLMVFAWIYMLVNSQSSFFNIKLAIKKNTQHFFKFWFQIWNQHEKALQNHSFPRRAYVKIFPYWMASLWGTNNRATYWDPLNTAQIGC